MKIIAQYQSYRLLVKFSRDPFSINCMNFLTLILYFLNQFGFRPKSYTLAALIHMCDAWYEDMDNGELNGQFLLIFEKLLGPLLFLLYINDLPA